jgi:hypothetical protein
MENTNMTLEGLKQYAGKPEIKAAGLEVLKLQAYCETIKPIVEAYQEKALECIRARDGGLERNKTARMKRDGRELLPEIKTIEDTWAMTDRQFNDYLDLCFEAGKAAGLPYKDREHCPLLGAQHELVQARARLMETVKPFSGIGAGDVYTRELRDKYLDICLGLAFAKFT